jgi:hypothetical protein
VTGYVARDVLVEFTIPAQLPTGTLLGKSGANYNGGSYAMTSAGAPQGNEIRFLSGFDWNDSSARFMEPMRFAQRWNGDLESLDPIVFYGRNGMGQRVCEMTFTAPAFMWIEPK